MIQELVKQRSLLLKEYEHERQQFQRMTENMGVRRRVKSGLCWFPLRVGRSFFNSLDQLVLEVERIEDTEVEHQFEPGKPVTFFQQDASEMLHYMRFVGQISFVEENRMVIIMPNSDAAVQVQNADRVGVQLYLDEYTYRLMFDALDRVLNAKEGRLAELRDIIHTQAPLHKFTFYPVRFPIVGKGCCCRSWSSWNRQDNHFGGGNLRNVATRASSACVCSE